VTSYCDIITQLSKPVEQFNKLTPENWKECGANLKAVTGIEKLNNEVTRNQAELYDGISNGFIHSVLV